jgi:hypothetical protein
VSPLSRLRVGSMLAELERPENLGGFGDDAAAGNVATTNVDTATSP